MLEFAPQCCDAALYLELAQACAADGQCYNDLRPMGTQLWFALPLWLGLPQAAAIVGHYLLLLLASYLSMKVLRSYLPAVKAALQPLWTALLWALTSAVHLLVFWPAMAVALADAVAGFAALIGMWSLLLCGQAAGWRRAIYGCAAGLALGLAVFSRAFYLYPVVLILVIYLLLQWRLKKLQLVHGVLLVALLPIATQYHATWRHTGQFGFIDPAMSSQFSGLHFRHAGIGYDTVLPGRAVSHFASCQKQRGGLIEIVMTLDIAELFCTLGGRLAFYAASDLRGVYIADSGYFNVNLYPEDLNLVGPWPRHNLMIATDDALAPNGEKTAERLIVSMHDSDEPAELNTVVINHTPAVYTASIWLWAARETPVVMRWMKFWGGDVLHQQQIAVGERPQRYDLSFLLPEGIFYFGLQLPMAEAGQSITAWGAQIEQASKASDYSEIVSPVKARNWSGVQALINAALFLLALSLLRQGNFRTAEFLTVFSFIALILAQSLLLVPEQRFVMVPQVAIIIFGMLALIASTRRICAQGVARPRVRCEVT